MTGGDVRDVRDVSREEAARDMAIQSQPILWAQAMLEEAEGARSIDARDAILARVGLTLFSRFAVTYSPNTLRRANQEWDTE